jgi:ketosteroid isomerase-like protein
MLRLTLSVAALALMLTPIAAQETNSGAARPAAERPAPAAARSTAQRRPASPTEATQRRAVEDAFNSLVDGIRRADAEAVMKLYWNSPRLILFNNNGTVTKTWEQSRSNRESIYARVKDVKLDVRDVNVEMLGRDGAVVSALWEQSQTADGQPERATGRMTLVFERIGTEWRIVHAHTSPDRPDPARLLPSERTTQPGGSANRP